MRNKTRPDTKREPICISKVVRKFHPMTIHYFASLISAFALLHCSGPATAVPLADLDYVEVKNQTGWVLRIHGDGGGRLTHKQLPAHHLHYPAETFVPGPGRQIASKCRGKNESPVCVRLRFYDALADDLTECPCAPGSWTTTIMEQAISQMEYAVDAGGSEASSRVLRKQWIASR